MLVAAFKIVHSRDPKFSRRRLVSILTTKRTRRQLLTELVALAAVTPVAGIRPGVAEAQGGVVTPDGRVYTAYVLAATKAGQFYQYSCEFDT